MDQGQGPQYNGREGQNEAHSYAFTQPPNNDPFNSFIHTEDEAAFDNTWQTPDFSNHHPPNHNYDQSTQHWPQTAFSPQSQNQSYMPMSQYGIDPRFSAQSGPNLQYASFGSNSAPAYSGRPALHAPAFNDSADFHSTALTDEPPFPYSRPGSSENANQTISPAAITTYAELNNLPHEKKHDAQPSQKFSAGPTAPNFSQKWGESFPSPMTIQDWRQLAAKSVKSIDRPGLHIKPTNQFENVTHTKRFDGFIFVGSSRVAVNVTKGNIPRYKRKKSRNELMRLFQIEKGDGPWPPEREHLVKKLKVTARKQSGPRPSATVISAKGSSSSDGSSESATDDSSSALDSDSEPEKEVYEPSPIPPTRPHDPNKAVEYDLLKAVWAKRSSVLSSPTIRTALAEVWDIFKNIRDKWKTKAANLQQAIEKKDQATEKAFERRVAEQRRLLENCINIVLKHGHLSIVEKLSQNPVLLVVFYQFLLDRFKDGETSGNFITSMLELMAKCSNLDSSLLEKTKLDKLLQRLLKRGDEKGKAFVRKVFENAKVADKGVVTTPQTNGQTTKTATNVLKAVDVNDSHKESLMPRKPSVEASTKSASSTPANKAQTLSNEPRVASKTKSEIASEGKTKVVNVTAKPSGFFSSLKSASKRPGTSTKVEESSKNSEQEKRPDIAPPSQKPAFSFAATMAGLAKQKEEIPVKAEESRKPETSEERMKRLRKESRRQLRVSFKSDDELVSVRTFVHDPEEEIGHDQSQVRDVGDSKGEGQMLKMHKDLELDDDEDYEPPEDFPPLWSTPLLTDFSGVTDEDRDRHYRTRGGIRELDATSTEREVQKSREDGTLMAMYSTLNDIPPTPREPIEGTKIEWNPEMQFGDPGDPTRSREANLRTQKQAQQVANAPPTPDISALLSIISNTPKTQPQQPLQSQYPPQQSSETSNPLASILAKISQNPQMQAVQPTPQTAPSLPFNLQAALASIQQPPQNVAPQPAWTPPQTGPMPTPNLQAILSQINQEATQPPVPPMQSYGYTSNQGSFPINEDRKRQMEGDDSTEQGRKRARGGKPFTGAPYLPCRFWQEGKCRKGDDCTFLHESA